jgi:hypothetical protein
MATNPQTAVSPLAATIPLWIGGGPIDPHSVVFGDVTNPTTGRVVRRVPFADTNDVDRAVRAAATAYPPWRATPPLRRARILTRFRELLSAHQADVATLISEEHGKVFNVRIRCRWHSFHSAGGISHCLAIYTSTVRTVFGSTRKRKPSRLAGPRPVADRVACTCQRWVEVAGRYIDNLASFI